MKPIVVDNSVSNSDWIKQGKYGFDFPFVETVEDFEREFRVPADEPARSRRLEELAKLPWVSVAPEPIRQFLLGVDKSLADLLKASFGGDRSAAGRYAAEQRWKGHVKREDKGKGQRSWKDGVSDLANVLRAVGGLPVIPPNGADGSQALPITPSQYDAFGSTSQFVYVRTGRTGKVLLVPTKISMEAEKAANEVGRQTFKEVGDKLVAEGAITQKELDDAIAFQEKVKEDDESAFDSLYQRALEGDKSLGKEVSDAVKKLAEAKVRAAGAKGALMKATREYNKYRNDGFNTMYDEAARRLWEARKQAKAASADARIGLLKAEEALRDLLGEKEPVDYKAQAEEEKAGKLNSLKVQGLIGVEVKRMLAETHAMSDTHPANKVTAPSGVMRISNNKLETKDGDQIAAEIMGEVSRRFPKKLLDLVAGVRHTFTSRGGGHFNFFGNEIRADLDDADTLTHETVHALSYADDATRVLEQAALSRRVFGKPNQPDDSFSKKLALGLQKVVGATKALGYRLNGKYIEDKFVSGYQGRMYGLERTGTRTAPSEILTVATENVFGGGHYFRTTGRMDRDLMLTALGWLLVGGSHRD